MLAVLETAAGVDFDARPPHVGCTVVALLCAFSITLSEFFIGLYGFPGRGSSSQGEEQHQ